MKNEIKIKALKVVEAMTSSDSQELNEEQQNAIYNFVHCALFECGKPNDEWIKKINKIYQVYLKI